MSEIEKNKAQFLQEMDEIPELIANLEREAFERQRIVEIFRASEAKLRLVRDQVPAALLIMDRQLRFTSALGAGLATLGLHPAQSVGLSLAEWEPTLVSAAERALTGESGESELTKDGHTYQIQFAPLRDGEGEVTGTVAVVLDISRRAQAETAAWSRERASWEDQKTAWDEERAGWLHQREIWEQAERQRTQALEDLKHESLRIAKALELSSDGIAVTDMAGTSVYYNTAFLDLFGYSPEELDSIGGASAIFVNPEVAGDVAAAIQTGGGWRGEVEIKTKEGRSIPTLLRAAAVADASGEPVGLVVVCADATDRKRAELYEIERKKVSELVARIEPLEKVLGQLSQLAGRK